MKNLITLVPNKRTVKITEFVEKRFSIFDKQMAEHLGSCGRPHLQGMGVDRRLGDGMGWDGMATLLKEGGDVGVIGETPVIRIALMRRVNSNPIRTANPADLG